MAAAPSGVSLECNDVSEELKKELQNGDRF